MMNRGITILEVIVAIFVLTIGMVGAHLVIQHIIYLTSLASSRLTAAYLAQEGIEIVRNIRDSNWLKQRTDSNISWDEGLPVGEWEADYNAQNLTDTYDGDFLKIDEGFYNYNSGTETKFKRKITIVKPEEDILEITVTVSWEEGAQPKDFTTKAKLYKWQGR